MHHPSPVVLHLNCYNLKSDKRKGSRDMKKWELTHCWSECNWCISSGGHIAISSEVEAYTLMSYILRETPTCVYMGTRRYKQGNLVWHSNKLYHTIPYNRWIWAWMNYFKNTEWKELQKDRVCTLFAKIKNTTIHIVKYKRMEEYTPSSELSLRKGRCTRGLQTYFWILLC